MPDEDEVVWCPLCGFEDGLKVTATAVYCDVCQAYVPRDLYDKARREPRAEYERKRRSGVACNVLEALE